jgi:hypothetical protein
LGAPSETGALKRTLRTHVRNPRSARRPQRVSDLQALPGSGRSRTRTWDLFLIRDDRVLCPVVAGQRMTCKSGKMILLARSRDHGTQRRGAPLVHPRTDRRSAAPTHGRRTIRMSADRSLPAQGRAQSRRGNTRDHALADFVFRTQATFPRASSIVVCASIRGAPSSSSMTCPYVPSVSRASCPNWRAT